MRRRDFLHSTLALSALATGNLAAADVRRAPGPAGPFNYAALKGQARALAEAEYRPPQRLAPESCAA